MLQADLERQLAEMLPGTHAALVYDSAAAQAAVFGPFVKHGLGKGERCLYIADDLTCEQVQSALVAAGVDVRAETERGRLMVLDRRQTYLRTGVFDPSEMLRWESDQAQQAAAEGYSGLRLAAEMTWVLGPEPGCEQFIPYEARLTQPTAGLHMIVLCQYNRHRFTASCLRDVLRTHPVVIVGDLVCPNLYFEPPEFVLDSRPDEAFVDWMLLQLRTAREKDLGRQLLLDAGRTLTSTLEYESTLEHVARVSIPLIADACAVDVLANDGLTRRMAAWHRDPVKTAALRNVAIRFRPDASSDDPVSLALASERPRVFQPITRCGSDAEGETRASQAFPGQDIASAIIVPLVARGRTLGVLTLIAECPGRPYSADDVQLAQELGALSALALDNADLLQRERSRLRRFHAVRKVAATMTRSLHLKTALRAVTRGTAGLVGNASAGLYLLADDGKSLIAQSAHRAGSTSIFRPATPPVTLGEGVVGSVAVTRRGIMVEDYPASPFALPSVIECTNAGPVLATPIIFQDRLVGVIALTRAQGETPFTDEDLWVVALLADTAAVAIENARLYGVLRDRELQLQDLVGQLLVSQEDERLRLAYDLHDGLAQLAASTSRHLQAFAEFYHPRSARARQELSEAVELSKRTVREARELIAGLRPAVLDDLGLAAALRMELDGLRRDGWEVSYADTLGSDRLPADVETALFRIGQEALTNVRKHTRPGPVSVNVDKDERVVRLIVRDSGDGFDASGGARTAREHDRLGLTSMRERVALLGGRLNVDSRPGEGTRIEVQVPLGPLTLGGGRNGAGGNKGATAAPPRARTDRG